MAVSRSWTPINDEYEISGQDQTYLDELMVEWSQIQSEIESDGFRRQAMFEDGEYDGPDFDSEEEAQEYAQRQRTKAARRQVRLDVIVGILHRMGARVMRPYEHWNEDERYMEYMERDR